MLPFPVSGHGLLYWAESGCARRARRWQDHKTRRPGGGQLPVRGRRWAQL